MGRFRVDVRDFPHNHYLLLKALYRVPAMRLAPLLAWMSADAVSWLAFACGAGGAAAIVADRRIVAVLLLHLSMLLDYTDGEVARYRNESSLRGAWMEVVLDKTQAILVFAAFGLGAMRKLPATATAAEGAAIWIWAGAALTAFLFLSLLRLQRVRLIDPSLSALRAAADPAGGGIPPRRYGWRVWVVALWRETSAGYVTWLWIMTLGLLTGGPLRALQWTALYGWVRGPLDSLVGMWRASAIDLRPRTPLATEPRA